MSIWCDCYHMSLNMLVVWRLTCNLSCRIKARMCQYLTASDYANSSRHCTEHVAMRLLCYTRVGSGSMPLHSTAINGIGSCQHNNRSWGTTTAP
jgi:hypothetical protein